MISAVLAAGVFVAVPAVGRWVLGPLRAPIPVIARPSLWICAGIAVWSIPLLGSAVVGVYHAEAIGALGWGAVAALLLTGRLGRPRIPRLGRWDIVVLVGVLVASALVGAYPADPFATGRDMGVYANHAVYVVNHARLDVPYPWAATDVAPPGFVEYAGVHLTEPTMTVRFGHLYPTWLAQMFATAGYEGLVRLNAVLGILSLLAIYGVGRRFLNGAIAALGTLFLAFNPSQIWTTRNTLSEIPTQLLMWVGLLLMIAYLARGQPRIGVWAGIFLGLAAVVRIDSLLLVPLLLAGHALWSVFARRERLTPYASWKPVYLGAVPLFVIAGVYYAFFSTPYLVDLGGQMRQIAILSAIGAGVLVLVGLPAMARRARSIVSSHAFGIAVLLGVVLAAGYTYYVRPVLPPLQLIDAPGHPLDGLRTYVETTLPTLGTYLTPHVIWAGVAGWWLAFFAAARRGRAVVLAPLLTVALGFSAAYLWNPYVSPDHFWAVRRFVPAVIPAFVLFAGFGLMVAVRRFPRRARLVVYGVTAALLVVNTALTGLPTYFVTERQGAYAALAEFSGSLSPDTTYLALTNHFDAYAWVTPLYLAFDRRVVALDGTTDDGRSEAIRRLRSAAADRPLPVVLTRATAMDAIQGVRTALLPVPIVAIQQSLTLPRVTFRDNVMLSAVLATGLSTTSVTFGAEPTWLAAESGFYFPLVMDGHPVRWTDGHAHLAIPVEGSTSASRMSISIASTGPEGTSLRLVLNGSTLFDGELPPGPWASEFDVARLEVGSVAELEIISSTFVTGDAKSDAEDKPMGVLVSGVMLLGDDEGVAR